ncbi:MAG: hypothetical protein Kow0060_14310 [Methylohalobius crimeensis]
MRKNQAFPALESARLFQSHRLNGARKRLVSGTALFLITVASTGNAQPELGAQTFNGPASNATFTGGASKDGGASFGHAFSDQDTVSVTIDIGVAPEHVNQTGAIVVFGSLNGRFFQQGSDGIWQVWDGNPNSLLAHDGPRTLEETESVKIFESGLQGFSGGTFQAIAGYRSPDGDVHFNSPPVEFVATGRCGPVAGSGSLAIDANNGLPVGEAVFRIQDWLADTSSLSDQLARMMATDGPGSISCTRFGNANGVESGTGKGNGRLNAGEAVSLRLDNCGLGDDVIMAGEMTVDVTESDGVADNSFSSDWSYAAQVRFDGFTHQQGATAFSSGGAYLHRVRFFAATGIQTFDFEADAISMDYNGIPLTVGEMCYESNALSASKVHTEAYRYRVQSEFGDVMVRTVEPFSGPFGGPPDHGVVEMIGQAQSRIVLDAGECGDEAFNVAVYDPSGALVTPSPNCIPTVNFED